MVEFTCDATWVVFFFVLQVQCPFLLLICSTFFFIIESWSFVCFWEFISSGLCNLLVCNCSPQCCLFYSMALILSLSSFHFWFFFSLFLNLAKSCSFLLTFKKLIQLFVLYCISTLYFCYNLSYFLLDGKFRLHLLFFLVPKSIKLDSLFKETLN